MSGFSAATTSDEVMKGVDLRGKFAIVTGASGGLGEESARALAAAGAHVTIVARNKDKAEEAARKIREKHPQGGPVDILLAELSEPESVKKCAEEWVALGRPLDLLLLNAGVMACPLTRTKEGWEMQFATNHFGHFIFTAGVASTLRSGGRVVVLSSAGHEITGVDFGDVHWVNKKYSPWEAYGQAKTANVLFAVELDRRLKGRGVRALAVHPGVIQTDLGRHITKDILGEWKVLMKTRLSRSTGDASKAPSGKPKSIPAGAATQLWAATSPQLEGKGGLYLADCNIFPAKEYATASTLAQQLWSLSEETLGLRVLPEAADASKL